MKTHLIRSLATAIVFTALTASPLSAVTVEELVAGLRVEIEKTVAEARTNRNSGGFNTASELERQLARLESAIARDNLEEADQTLNQLALTKLTLEAKERISQLQREIPKAADARQKAFIAQVGAAIENAGKACLAAKSENDLDGVLLELGTLKRQRIESNSANSEQRQRLNARLDGAIRFVNRWQDYLVQSSRGFDATARNILRELADPSGVGSQSYPILPRAEIVARIGSDQDSPEQLLRGIKTLDELPKTILELTRLSRENSNRTFGSNEFSTVLNELQQIARAHAAFKAGNYGSALATAAQWEGTGGLRSPESMRLKTMLLLQVIPRYLELPNDPQPKEGENPSEFLLRLAGESAEQKDWPRVARVLDAYRLTAFGYRQAPAWVTADIEACQQFIAGQNLEKSRRFVPAILAYQRVLKTPGKYSPHAAAAERLAALEKEQSEAFAEAGKEPAVRELLDALHSTPQVRASGFTLPQ